MLHSIRWRLTAGFTLLTLLTVALLGVIILALMQRSLEQQVDAYLRANAQAVARQSQLFFAPAPQQAQLAQLAQTTAFLGDVQVRILDHEQQLLAAAGTGNASAEMTWVFRNTTSAAPGQPLETMILVAPALASVSSRTPVGAPAVEPYTLDPLAQAPVTGAISVRRLPSPWGDRLFFRNERVEAEVVGEAVLAQRTTVYPVTGTTPLSPLPT